MTNTFLSSKLGKIVANKEHFKQMMGANFNRYSYRLVQKTKEEQDIDEIVGKRILQHLKKFFYEKTNKTYKKRGRGMGRCRLRGDSPPVRFRLQGRPLTKSVLGFYTLGSSCQRFAPKAKPQQAL